MQRKSRELGTGPDADLPGFCYGFRLLLRVGYSPDKEGDKEAMTRREVFKVLAAGAVGLILPPTKKFFVFGEGLWTPAPRNWVKGTLWYQMGGPLHEAKVWAKKLPHGAYDIELPPDALRHTEPLGIVFAPDCVMGGWPFYGAEIS